MFKKPTKKQFLIRRIALSVLATVSVLIIVTASILFMLGYRLDGGNGRLEQGALLQFNSTPDGAQIWIDDQFTNSQTSSKRTVVAGTHSIMFSKQGYENWNRTLNLDAGTLTWLDYARLVPKERPVEAVGYYNTLAAMQFSPDLKWALGQEVATEPVFQLVDLRANEIKSSTLTLPATLYSESATPEVTHNFAVYRWSNDARYAIIKHVYADTKTEWLMLDTQDINRSINITRLLNVDLSDVKFANTSGMTLFGLTTDGVLRKLDLSGETISRGLVTQVKEFSVFESGTVVSYVGADPANAQKTVAGIYKDGDSASRVLRSVDTPNATLKINVARYFSDDYVAISEGSKVDVFVGSIPSATQETNTLRLFKSFTLSNSVSELSFSPRSEYVIAQAGSEFKTYELEHQRTAAGTVTPAEGRGATTLKWLDAAHLWNDDTRSFIMRDFDGSNTHSIMAVEPGFGASLSQNGRYIYTVGKAEDGRYQLQRVRMILN